MSLSFVSKTIQTGRDDGGFDETPVENSRNDNVAISSSAQKPLFEQLRANKEQEDEERAEFQRSIMRGTLALDEEDCAHLDSLSRKRAEEQLKRQQETEQDLALFRAQRADRVDTAQPRENTSAGKAPAEESNLEKRPARVAPKIVVKKRKLKNSNEPEKQEKPNAEGSLGLLAGYGSSSDEEDD